AWSARTLWSIQSNYASLPAVVRRRNRQRHDKQLIMLWPLKKLWKHSVRFATAAGLMTSSAVYRMRLRNSGTAGGARHNRFHPILSKLPRGNGVVSRNRWRAAVA